MKFSLTQLNKYLCPCKRTDDEEEKGNILFIIPQNEHDDHFKIFLDLSEMHLLPGKAHILQASLALFTVFIEPISIKLFCCSSSVILREKVLAFFTHLYWSPFKTKAVKTIL